MGNQMQAIENGLIHHGVSEQDQTEIEGALDLLYGKCYHIGAEAKERGDDKKRAYYRKIHEAIGDLKKELLVQENGDLDQAQPIFDRWAEDSIVGYAFD